MWSWNTMTSCWLLVWYLKREGGKFGNISDARIRQANKESCQFREGQFGDMMHPWLLYQLATDW